MNGRIQKHVEIKINIYSYFFFILRNFSTLNENGKIGLIYQKVMEVIRTLQF